ncbi:MAG: hypothetical protein QME52_12695 [Bacteroidota bacterium]|nr:hypothetical protein [Bacteroidota bacterium]
MENKRYHILIGSVLFAILTWISINLSEEFSVAKTLPVVIENLKEGKALKHSIPKFVNAHFRGRGWALAGLYLSPQINYYIDVSSIGSKDFLITSKNLLEHVNLPTALRPIAVEPDTIILAIDNYWEKKVPVIPRIVLGYREGYGQVGPMEVTPESISIGGSENVLKDILAFHTIYRKYDNLTTPIDDNIPLEDPASHSIELVPRSVRLHVNVQPFAEKTFLGIPIIVETAPTNREVIFIPPKMDIIVRGGIEQLAKLKEEDFRLHINYQNLIQDSSKTFVPVLTAPSEIRIVSKKPERFQFIIRKKL